MTNNFLLLSILNTSLIERLECGDFGCLDSAHHVMMTDIIPPQMSQKFLMVPSLES